MSRTPLKRATAAIALAAVVSLAGSGVASARVVDLTEDGRGAALVEAAETSETDEPDETAKATSAKPAAEKSSDPAEASEETAAEPVAMNSECRDSAEAAVESNPDAYTEAESEVKAEEEAGSPNIIDSFLTDAQAFIFGGGLSNLTAVASSAVGLYNQAMANPASVVDPGFWGRVLNVITGAVDILKGLDKDNESSSLVHTDDTLEIGGTEASAETKEEIEKRLAEDTESDAAQRLISSLEQECLDAANGADPKSGTWSQLNEELAKAPEDVDQERVISLLDEVEAK